MKQFLALALAAIALPAFAQAQTPKTSTVLTQDGNRITCRQSWVFDRDRDINYSSSTIYFCRAYASVRDYLHDLPVKNMTKQSLPDKSIVTETGIRTTTTLELEKGYLWTVKACPNLSPFPRRLLKKDGKIIQSKSTGIPGEEQSYAFNLLEQKTTPCE